MYKTGSEKFTITGFNGTTCTSIDVQHRCPYEKTSCRSKFCADAPKFSEQKKLIENYGRCLYQLCVCVCVYKY